MCCIFVFLPFVSFVIKKGVSCDPFSVRSILHCLETSIIYLYVCVENGACLKLYVGDVRQCHSWNSKLIGTAETETL